MSFSNIFGRMSAGERMGRIGRARARNAVPPAPKLRARPGEIYRKKKRPKGDKDHPFWIVKYAYRLKENPSIWWFVMEERKDLSDPTTALSAMCDAVSTAEGAVAKSPVVKEPFRTGMDVYPYFSATDYAHGDRVHVNTQDLLNQYAIVSSGEVHDSK